MNVLLVNTTCKVGGVSTFLLALRRTVIQSGHSCELFFFEHGPMEALLPPGVPVHFGSLADLLRLVKRRAIDVVHANNVDWPLGVSAVRELGVRLVVTAHKVRVNATYGWTSRNCDAFTTVAGWIARDLQPSTDLPILTVPNGIDTTRFQPARERAAVTGGPIVAWIGRSGSAHKRLDLLAGVAPALRDAGARVWVIDQHGPAALAALCGADVSDQVAAAAERWESVPFEAMPALYREVAASGGCVLSTSQSEGLPLALLEAQASGCPVIASDVRGNNEAVFPAQGGVLYPLDMPAEALAALVTGRLQNARLLAADGQRSAEHIRANFSVSRMADQYRALYEGARPRDTRSAAARRHARRRLSPLRDWPAYADYRWGTGDRQLQAARMLLAQDEPRLAAAATRAALSTAPTLFLKPARSLELLRTAPYLTQRGSSMMRALRQWLAVSPRHKAPKTCGDEALLQGRSPAQMDWYAFAADLATGQSVLDVGCGSGEGLRLLSLRASSALGIDLDDRLRRPDVPVEIRGIEDMPDKSFDVVVCLDVIEHVERDRDFIGHLVRVARKTVFVTTPNYTISRNRNPYHVREYTPAEFDRLFTGHGRVRLLGGSAHGAERAEITGRGAYFLVNELYAWKPTLLAAKVLKRLLHVRMWKHQAVVLQLESERAPAVAAA